MGLRERIEVQYGGAGTEFAEAPPLPRNMMVELSNACNHACAFCPNPFMERPRGRIERELLLRVMREAADGGVRELGFYTTGEPFIHKDLPAFTRAAKEAGFAYVYISTNGALATPERARAVIDAGMDSIKFSINAGSRETYREIHGQDEFDLVLGNLQFMAGYRRERGLPLKLYATCVVTQPMEHEIGRLRELLEPLVDEIAFDGCMPLAWPDPSAPGAARICPMPFNRLHVTCEGYLTLCCVDFENYLAVADLNAVPLVQAWNSPAFRDMRRRHLAGDLAGSMCGRCWQGDRTPVKPLNDALAHGLDWEAYDGRQRNLINAKLRIHPR